MTRRRSDRHRHRHMHRHRCKHRLKHRHRHRHPHSHANTHTQDAQGAGRQQHEQSRCKVVEASEAGTGGGQACSLPGMSAHRQRHRH